MAQWEGLSAAPVGKWTKGMRKTHRESERKSESEAREREIGEINNLRERERKRQNEREKV